ncbi:unnamed protein product [Coffea canephora]|uniref:non-specific serine/threonine protein kinase n=1 Tax=Coffea canephora TaxID=49390 RepID=A0A068UM17_COFCA|nr:unnamed protein product [Coffea canephora]
MGKIDHYLFLISFSLVSLAMMAAGNSNVTTDQLALLVLRDRMINSEPREILAKNWSITSSVCDWIGVTCGFRHHRVTALNISNMNLTGTLPPQLGNLSFLVSLNISRNNFHGELPGELVHLRRLRYLDFGINNLGGELPSWFGFLYKLQFLSLGNNSFMGSIPPSISNMSNLETLLLSFNFIEGTVPIEFQNLHNLKNLLIEYNQLSGPLPLHVFNLSSLQIISFMSNSLSGILPDDACQRLQKLTWLSLEYNNLIGRIPSTVSQCSLLRYLASSENRLSGPIPMGIANLTMLEELYLESNNLTGKIYLISLCFCSSIWRFQRNRTFFLAVLIDSDEKAQPLSLSLSLSLCNFAGAIPNEIGNLTMLTALDFHNNKLIDSSKISSLFVTTFLHYKSNQTHKSCNFVGAIPNEIGNLTMLTILYFYDNKLTGVIPAEIGNLAMLMDLDFSNNKLTGGIPEKIGNLHRLEELYLYNNALSGSIPAAIFNISSLQHIGLDQNKFSGTIPLTVSNNKLSNLESLFLERSSIPTSLASLRNLKYLYLDYNRLSSESSELSFFTFLTSSRSLTYLVLGNNPLNGFLPASFSNYSTSLEVITAKSCRIKGNIPDGISNLSSLVELEFSGNELIGSVPRTIHNSNRLTSMIPTNLLSMKDLQILNLSSNFLSGSLPLEIGNLKAAYSLDISFNQLSDKIPTTIGELQALQSLSLANNNLQGQLFMNNEGLCGDPRLSVPLCQSNSIRRSSKRKVLLLVISLSGMAAILIIAIGALLNLRWLKKPKSSSGIELMSAAKYERFSYYDLLHSTDNYNESNLLGEGSYGSVYKGILSDGTIVAIKVFNLLVEGSLKSFDKECEVLKSLRHRNLIKVLGSCCNPNFKALVLKYMPNGNLEKWLYSHNHFLDMFQRINIMIDVACALEYLHYGYDAPVVHCDLKPSNILLDEDMAAHVSDFGIAKMFGQGESILHTNTLATLGYIAPEYGSEGIVSTRIDVYSFGIVLMEIFSRMRPSDETFSGDLSLKSWVEDSLPNALQVVDANLIRPEDEHFTDKLKCVTLIMKLALNCCTECPRERISMKDVFAELIKIKHQFQFLMTVSIYPFCANFTSQ